MVKRILSASLEHKHPQISRENKSNTFNINGIIQVHPCLTDAAHFVLNFGALTL